MLLTPTKPGRVLAALSARILLPALLAAAVSPAHLAGQAPAPAAAQAPTDADTLARLTALRDAFIARTRASGHPCSVAPPTVVVTHIPSFGNYDDSKNTLYTADWTKLDPEEKGFFVHLAGPGADDATAHAIFEDIAHRWIFVHELGHWWQGCRQPRPALGHYQTEYDADRIAMAYWREVDPSVTVQIDQAAQAGVDHTANPTPQGQVVEAYFNANYDSLGPTPAYRWYQARMIVSCYAEAPPPSFASTLAAPAK